MTDTPDQPPEQPATEQLPIVSPQPVDHITVQPVEDYLLGLPAEPVEQPEVAPPADVDRLKKRPFRGTRFTVHGDTVTALRYVQEGKGRTKFYTPDPLDLEISRSRVDRTLIRKLRVTPEDGEDEIRYLQRHHWWMFGHILVPHTLLWLAVAGLYGYSELDRSLGGIGSLVLALWPLTWIYFVGGPLLRWYFTIVLVTNTRIHHIRTYPVIRLTQHNMWLSALTDVEVIPVKFGFHYAKLIATIPGSDSGSAWLTKEGLRYLVDYEELESLVKPHP